MSNIVCCKQVREKESDSDGLIGPVEDMYALLGRYEVRLPAEELAAVSDLRYSWRKLLDLASATSNTLSQLQVRGFWRVLDSASELVS